MRAVFFGTPQIAVPSLEALVAIADVVAVVCQPDKPAGRGLALTAPPLKARALELGLDVHQPTKVRTPDFAGWLTGLGADVALVIAYGRILPRAVLDAPASGCLNLHASLLPKYRGAAPITWAIANGERETGVCLMQMDEGMDTGPVLSTHRLTIGEDETADELGARIGALAAEVVRADVARAVRGEIAPAPQDHAAATTARILEKEDGRIDWSRPARAVHDHARAMTSWPGAFTTLGGKLFKVLATKVEDERAHDAAPGTIVRAAKADAIVACGAGTLRIVRGQLEGKKALTAADLVGGRTLALGAKLG